MKSAGLSHTAVIPPCSPPAINRRTVLSAQVGKRRYREDRHVHAPGRDSEANTTPSTNLAAQVAPRMTTQTRASTKPRCVSVRPVLYRKQARPLRRLNVGRP